MKLYDSELKVMEILWNGGDLTAKQISDKLHEEIGWNKNTTYTVIKKCINKGAIKRSGNNYLCTPIVSREEVEDYETKELIEKYFDGSGVKLFAAFLNRNQLSDSEREMIRKMIEKE